MESAQQASRCGRSHHWVIETPAGATSRGRCKQCGSVKTFLTAEQQKKWSWQPRFKTQK